MVVERNHKKIMESIHGMIFSTNMHLSCEGKQSTSLFLLDLKCYLYDWQHVPVSSLAWNETIDLAHEGFWGQYLHVCIWGLWTKLTPKSTHGIFIEYSTINKGNWIWKCMQETLVQFVAFWHNQESPFSLLWEFYHLCRMNAKVEGAAK
jgi:hypothetical protein